MHWIRMLPAVVTNSVYIRFASKMKIVEMVQGLPELTELLEPVDQQETDDVLNELCDSETEWECQNNTDLSYFDYTFECQS